MSFLSRLFKKQETKTTIVTMIGPPRSGKTTLIIFLETGEPILEDLPTTLGIDFRKNPVDLAGWKVWTIDTGGQEIYQQTFWELAIQQAETTIFVIDATSRQESDPQQFELMVNQLYYALDILPEGTPILLLLNKQDLADSNPMTAAELLQVIGKDALTGRSIALMPGSDKYGDGIAEAMKWIIERVDEMD